MADSNEKSYILGTEDEELHRLGLQHQVWAAEARASWKLAEFSDGDTLLDLGCGPGFCTRDLAYIVGHKGKVIGIDRSPRYIEFLQQTADLHKLPIEARLSDFDNMELEDNSLDGVYDRWALAWIPNPEEIVNKVVKALKPGGVFIIQEYYDWRTLQVHPEMPGLTKGIKGAFQSFAESDSEINIGRYLPGIFQKAGLEIISQKPLTKIMNPGELDWQWPKTFFNIYFPKVKEYGFLSQQELDDALREMDELELIPEASILGPHMIEVIAVKV